MSTEKRDRTIGYGTLFAIALGGVLGALTLTIQELSVISEGPIMGAVQHSLLALLFPGILGAAALGGNVHAWSLIIAAGINGLIYFVLGWLAFRLIAGLVRRKS